MEYLVAVAEERSFTRAAHRLHVAQPGISAQIRQLERELGQPLFDRSGRAVRLTATGTAVLPHARAALAARESMRSTVEQLTGLLTGRLAVGMVTACSMPLLFDALAEFHEQHPGVEMALREDASDRLASALRDGELDLALIGVGGAVPAGMQARVLVEEPLVAAVPPAHALAHAGSVSLGDLEGHPVITLPRGTGIRGALDDAASIAGSTVRVALEASDPRVVARLAARGLGVAIVPASTVRDQDGLVALPVSPAVHAALAIASPSGRVATPAARALTAVLVGRPVDR